MSHAATAWAISVREITSGEFRVLMTLADCHNPRRGCFPQQEYLRDACEMSNGALNSNLSKLESKGLIERKKRGNRNSGGRASTYYILGFDLGLTPECGDKVNSGESETRGGLTPEIEGVNSGQPETEPVKEPVKRNEPVSVCDFSGEIADAFSAYNNTAQRAGWPKVQSFTADRRKALKARLKECGGLSGWTLALEKAEASDFLCSRTGKTFSASFDFLTQKKSFTRLMEGNYDNRSKQTAKDDPTLRAIARAAGSF